MERAVLLDVYAEANIIIKSVKKGQIPKLSFRLCPDWTGPNKSGCSPIANAQIAVPA